MITKRPLFPMNKLTHIENVASKLKMYILDNHARNYETLYPSSPMITL